MRLQSIHEKGRYKNYRNFNLMGDDSSGSMLKEWFFSKNIREPGHRLPYKPIDPDALFTGAEKSLRATWLGHSSFIVELDGMRILLDPVLADDVSPVPLLYSVRRFQEHAPISAEAVPEADVAILSHDHYDHLDKKTIQAIQGKVKRFIVPMGVDRYLVDWGVSVEKITVLDWSQSVKIGNHRITALPSQHFSGRGLFSRNKTLWASWSIAGPHHKLYFSGDTGYHETFKRIGELYGPFDLVILDTGQFGVHWPFVHMFPEQSVQAFLDLKGKIYLPAHWGSFNLSTHNWFDPIERAITAAIKNNVPIAIPFPGETIDIGNELPDIKWWK